MNAKGDPLTFDVTGGEAHEVKGYDAFMELHDVHPDKLLGNKGYDSDDMRNDLKPYSPALAEPVVVEAISKNNGPEKATEDRTRYMAISHTIQRNKARTLSGVYS